MLLRSALGNVRRNLTSGQSQARLRKPNNNRQPGIQGEWQTANQNRIQDQTQKQ